MLKGRGGSRGGFRGGAAPATRGGRNGPYVLIPSPVNLHYLTTQIHDRPQPTMDKPKREAILDLAKYVNERIRVKFTGGREGQPVPLSATSTRR